MATCGYLCPKCEGTGTLENGDACDWCTITPQNSKPIPTDDELADWIKQVHEGPCCADSND
jgi:hypothetical protein